MALHAAVELEDKVGKAAVVPPRADGIGKQAETGELIHRVIARVESALERGGAHGFGALLIGDLEIRSQTKGVAVLTQDIRAEAVDGADLRTAAQRALAAQTAAAGIGGKARGKLLHDPAAKLRRGGAGEGDDKEAVKIDRVGIVTDIAHEAFGEHAGLAAARARGHEHGTAARIYRGLLRGCGSEISHWRRPPP